MYAREKLVSPTKRCLHGYDLWGQRNNMFSPYYYELSGAVKVQDTNSSSSDYNTESWLGRAMYNYDNRYFGQFSLVHQASSMFAPEHRWGTFWSVSAGWNINRESWFIVIEVKDGEITSTGSTANSVKKVVR